ncbi:MAG: 1-acyl-sn-glycerol-3-phosphate acyltransferase [Candidatus Nanopelagicales bacterium]|nr:1-acyl-sn-glycerol-3-phosphate acyltransferase [Candidatus Nanopelagicales bacterium]MDZ4249403.1 1-acyl-sn-glycerol-3-phosphate acyltransferase [Candidatus Nanopelagicales bacterium]
MLTAIDSPEFSRALDELEEQTGQPREQLIKEARSCLAEMAARPTSLAVAGWDKFCRWLARAYKLDVDDEAIDQLKVLARDATLIFLPNHRSYLDPLVLHSALERHDFPPNHVLGGANLAIWPLAGVGQRSGLVFIRREFKNAPVYRAVLRAYLSSLLKSRTNLEWYIEGGRTRTGKLRPPRYGVLSYVIDAFAEDPENDVFLIPTSVIYDQQHEVGAISAEEMGGAKSPESLGWLYNFAKSQSRRLGRAHLRFGEPLALRSAIALTEDENGRPRPRLAVAKVAFEVCNRINNATPVTPTALVTFALLDNDDRAITVREGAEILRPLLEYIQVRELPVTGDVDLSGSIELPDAVNALVREGVVTRHDGGTEPVFVIPRDQQLAAAFYRNTIIHFFITRAIVEVALLGALESGADDISSATWASAKRLKDLLKFEFFFPRTREFAEAVAEEARIVDPDWQLDAGSSVSVQRLFESMRLFVAPRVIAPFLEAYLVVADRLADHDPESVIDQDALIEQCFGVGQQWWLQRKLHSPESISKDLFRNALKLADNFGLMGTGGQDLRERRRALADELRESVRRVRAIRMLSRSRWEAELDV